MPPAGLGGNIFGGGMGGGGGPSKFQGAGAGSFGGDPALIQAQANINQALAAAEQEAMREMRQLLIDYGDPELAAKYLKEPLTEQDQWWLHNAAAFDPSGSGGRVGSPDQWKALLNQMAHPTPAAAGGPFVKNMWGSYDWDPAGAAASGGIRPGSLTPEQQHNAKVWQKQLDQMNAQVQGTYYTSEQEAQAALARMGAPQMQGWGTSYQWMQPNPVSPNWNIQKVHQGRGIDVQAAMDNPYSVLKRLSRQQTNEQFDANENLNKANLFYSSERGRVLKELGTDAQGRSYDAARQVQDQLNAIQSQLLQAQQEAQQQLAQATLEAQQKKNQQILGAQGGR